MNRNVLMFKVYFSVVCAMSYVTVADEYGFMNETQSRERKRSGRSGFPARAVSLIIIKS